MKLKKLFGFIFAAAASVMLLAACTTTEAPEITPAPATSTPAPAEQTKSLEELTQDKHYAEITVNVNGEDKTMKAELYPDVAPETVANLKSLQAKAFTTALYFTA